MPRVALACMTALLLAQPAAAAGPVESHLRAALEENLYVSGCTDRDVGSQRDALWARLDRARARLARQGHGAAIKRAEDSFNAWLAPIRAVTCSADPAANNARLAALRRHVVTLERFASGRIREGKDS